MLKLLTRLKAKELILIAISIVFIVVQVWLDLMLPDYMANITTLVQTPGNTIREILNQGVGMLLCITGSLITSIIVGYLSSFIGSGFSKNLREELNISALNIEKCPSVLTIGIDNIVTKAWDKKIASIPTNTESVNPQSDLDIPSFLRKNKGLNK